MSQQVWIGPKIQPALDSPKWLEVAERPRPWQQGGSAAPFQPPSLACRIVAGHSSTTVRAVFEHYVPPFSSRLSSLHLVQPRQIAVLKPA